MLYTLSSALIGLLCGLLSGLGVGGGSLLVLYLTCLGGVSPEAARGVNLLFFLPTAFVALLLHAKNRCVVWSVAIPAAVAGCLAGGLLAWFAAGLNSGILRYAFGTYLLATGMWELLSALRKTESA